MDDYGYFGGEELRFCTSESLVVNQCYHERRKKLACIKGRISTSRRPQVDFHSAGGERHRKGTMRVWYSARAWQVETPRGS